MPFLPSGPSCHTTKVDDIMAPVLGIPLCLSCCHLFVCAFLASSPKVLAPKCEVLRGLRNRIHDFVAAERDGGLLQNPKLNGTAQVLRRPEQPPRLDSLLRSEPSRMPSVCHDYWEAAPLSPLRLIAFVACRDAAAFISWVAMCMSSFSMTSSRSSVARTAIIAHT
jgi:hypothetical protein